MRLSAVAALLFYSGVAAIAGPINGPTENELVKLGAAVLLEPTAAKPSNEPSAQEAKRHAAYLALAQFAGLHEKAATTLLAQNATQVLGLAACHVLMNDPGLLQPPATATPLVPALARHEASRGVGQTRENLNLAMQYFLLFAPQSQATRLFNHIGALTHQLTQNYQRYTQVLLAPVMSRYYAWLPRLNELVELPGLRENGTKALNQLGVEYSRLNLQEGTAIMNRVEQGTLVADKMPLGVHAAFGRELDDLRFLTIAAGQRAQLTTEIGPSLLMFNVHCKSRHYDDAQAVLAELEAELAPSLGALQATQQTNALTRAAQLVPPLLAELREVARRMQLADQLLRFFDLPGTSQSKDMLNILNESKKIIIL